MAERSPGFVWRLVGDTDASPGATSLRFPGDADMLVNMSVWETPNDLRHFVYNTAHRKIYARKDEWFQLMTEHHFRDVVGGAGPYSDAWKRRPAGLDRLKA